MASLHSSLEVLAVDLVDRKGSSLGSATSWGESTESTGFYRLSSTYVVPLSSTCVVPCFTYRAKVFTVAKLRSTTGGK